MLASASNPLAKGSNALAKGRTVLHKVRKIGDVVNAVASTELGGMIPGSGVIRAVTKGIQLADNYAQRKQ